MSGCLSDFEHVADLTDLPDGAMLGVERSDGTEICVYNFRGSIGAIGNICTHAEFLMSDGSLRSDGSIECAWHGARFDRRTGRVCRGPAEDPLPVYTVRVEAGRVLVGPGVGDAAA
jgi:3-phenylpropionate/trans-cinnamate dioxygenase ferredoxin subunit